MKFRNNRYRKTKWINTGFSAPYRKKWALARMRMTQAYVTGMAQLSVIRAQPVNHVAEKLVATAQAIISTNKAILKAAEGLKAGRMTEGNI